MIHLIQRSFFLTLLVFSAGSFFFTNAASAQFYPKMKVVHTESFDFGERGCFDCEYRVLACYSGVADHPTETQVSCSVCTDSSNGQIVYDDCQCPEGSVPWGPGSVFDKFGHWTVDGPTYFQGR